MRKLVNLKRMKKIDFVNSASEAVGRSVGHACLILGLVLPIRTRRIKETQATFFLPKSSNFLLDLMDAREINLTILV